MLELAGAHLIRWHFPRSYWPQSATLLRSNSASWTAPNTPPAQPGQLGSSAAAQKKAADAAARTYGESTATYPADTGTYTLPGVTVRYVLVPTTVLDPDGHGYVNGLHTKNFRCLRQRQSSEISAEFTQLPMSVVLAVQANSEIDPCFPKLQKDRRAAAWAWSPAKAAMSPFWLSIIVCNVLQDFTTRSGQDSTTRCRN